MNYTEMLSHMGGVAIAVVVILVLMSLYLLAVSVERFFFFLSNKRKSRQMVIAIRELFEKEGFHSLEKVDDIVGTYHNVPLASVVDAASEAFQKRSKDIDALDLVVGINRAVERTIERQTSRLKRGFGGLATIASTAPFVGLFGTTFGIINAFQALSEAKGKAGMDVIGAGIAEALVTTAVGLGVAILSVAAYNYFTGVVDGMVVDMDEVASEMVEAVVLRDKKV